MVQYCWLLIHENQRMMDQYNISDKEGVIWSWGAGGPSERRVAGEDAEETPSPHEGEEK